MTKPPRAVIREALRLAQDSRHKRRLGSAVHGRSEGSCKRECSLRVLTHNHILLAEA